MYRISVIISEIYNKFLPLAEQNNIQLNLDLVDTEVLAAELAGIKDDVEKAISDALGRTSTGEISIKVNKNEIIVSDTGTTLSKTVCDLLSKGRISVRSRVGFGTKVHIDLTKHESLDDGEQQSVVKNTTDNSPRA